MGFLRKKEVRGSNGYFSGWGYITLPFLESLKEVIDVANVANVVSGGEVNIGKFSRIRVEFDNIKINTDYQLVEGIVETSYDPNWSGIVDVDEAIADIGQFLAELFSRKEELLTELSEAEGFEEQQSIITQINDLEVTIGQQIDQIPNKENLPQELQDELESLKKEGDIVANSILTPEEIESISTADAQRRERIQEIAAIAENFVETNANSEEVAFDENEGYLLEGGTSSEVVVYVSPAGVPVTLPGPKEVPVKFYTTKNGITAYGTLQSFTIKDGPNAGVYQAHRKGNEFTGYKISKGEEPYDFGELPNPNNIFVRTIDQGLGCSHLLLEGHYKPTNVNTTGEGALITDWGDTQWNLLPIEKQGYVSCLPNLDYDGFTEYFMGIYNPYGHGGFLRKVVAMDGSVAHVYSIADLESGWVMHYQYNWGNGRWEPIAIPEYNVDTAAALDYLFGQVFTSAAGHLVLDAAGMVPVAGEVFDALNGVWYTIEGDGKSAAISFASTIPLVYATTVKNAGRVIKLADGSYQILKISSKEAEAFINQINKLNLDDDALKLLNEDLNNKVFAEAIAENPELVKSWNVLKNTGLKTNLKWLERVSDFKKVGLQLVEEGSEVKILRQGDEISKISEDVLQIKIPDHHGSGGWAKQSTSLGSLSVLNKVDSGEPMYRIGTLSQSSAAEAQYWSLENPLDIYDVSEFAKKYGIPEENLISGDFFVEIAKPKLDIPKITREAPGVGKNVGGSIEIVVPRKGVILESFHTIKF